MSRLSTMTRRQVMLTGSASVAAAIVGARAATAAAPSIRLGYAAITWGEDTKTAISDISALGYPGIQLRPVIMKAFASSAELKETLAKAKLDFVCFSGGGPDADPAKRADVVGSFMKSAKFVREAGCTFIQCTSPGRKGGAPDAAALKAYGELLTDLGKRTADIGLTLAFHNHMNQLGESPAEVDAILAAANPKQVKFLLDTGHYQAAGGDPAAVIRKYGSRLVMMHLKDVKREAAGGAADAKRKYGFVELGQGEVDFKAVWKALGEIKYRGWAVVELDSVPKERAPKDAAAANKAFLEKALGARV